jgi:Tfp pilus assembly protein PilW
MMRSANSQHTHRMPFSPRAHAGSGWRSAQLPARARGLNGRHCRGLGLAELLISLAISAMLLTAMAVAIDASFKSYQVNEEQSTLTQRARLALYRMLTNIRTTAEHQPYSSNQIALFASGQTVTDTGLSMFDNNNNQITYMYDAPSQQLRMIEGGATHVMLNGVTSFQVKMMPMKSANAIKTGSLTFDLLERATILVSLQTNSKTSESSESTGKQTVTISSSVMPRRNVW